MTTTGEFVSSKLPRNFPHEITAMMTSAAGRQHDQQNEVLSLLSTPRHYVESQLCTEADKTDAECCRTTSSCTYCHSKNISFLVFFAVPCYSFCCAKHYCELLFSMLGT